MTYAVLRRHALVTLAIAVLVALLPLYAPLRAQAATAPAASTASATTTAAKTTTVEKAVVKKQTPKQIARTLAAKKYKWKSAKQWNCLRKLWHKESKWKVKAGDPSGGAYGIPQAYPGKKMGKGWRTSATTQIKWGLKYIDGRYDTPCGAYGHSTRKGWY